ncbi:MAG: LL-diaminopimelate aminotransferase [Actinobacteria bacterium]|nr:LL-diaminopimelate aminotransferase [Actinomycetota bacterium]
MRFSKKLELIPPYLFAEIEKKLEQKKQDGIDVISFGIGDPDMPTPHFILEAMWEASENPAHHQYPSYFGMRSFREEIAEWMYSRFQVSLDPQTEVIPLIGSKEGIAHIAFSVVDQGDVALVPEPCYPVYAMATILAGGDVQYLPLAAENGFLPDFENIPADASEKAKILWLNYPNNPTGAVVDMGFFEEAVKFSSEKDIIVANDNAYSEITYDGYIAPSILQIEGAIDNAVEFFSLSKSYNMSGWRVGFACGNSEIIKALGTIKTNIDSGIFNPIQVAAIHALEQGDLVLDEIRATYRQRRDKLAEALRGLGWNVVKPKGAIYLWLPVPDGFDSVGFSNEVLEKADVFFTPGNGYGPTGEGFVRLSLTVPDIRIEEAVNRLKEVF